MAVLSNTQLTLLDWTKRRNPDGSAADIAQLLSQTNMIWQQAIWQPSNAPNYHRITQCTGLPDIYYRELNAGVPSSKSTAAQIDEPMALMEARSVVDIDVVDLDGDRAMTRANEAQTFIEAMGQKGATTFFYGNTTTDRKVYPGLATRFSDSAAGNGQNILKAGGTGGGSVYTSIWLINWHRNGAYMVFPRGNDNKGTGIYQQDLGQQTIENAGGVTGNYMEALVELFKWQHGFALRDWRNVVRIPNIVPTDALGVTGTQELTDSTNIVYQMARALARIPEQYRSGNMGFYMNRTIFSALMIQGLNRSQSAISVTEGLNQFGMPMETMKFLGIPIYMCDAITNTEAEVS